MFGSCVSKSARELLRALCYGNKARLVRKRACEIQYLNWNKKLNNNFIINNKYTQCLTLLVIVCSINHYV